jgi:hypothetical protein
MAIPASLFRHVGLWNEQVGRKGEHRGTFEDTEYQDRVRAAVGTVWFCPSATLKHRVGRDRIEPHTIMSRAFARGRNEYLRELLRTRGTIDNPPRENGLFRLTIAHMVQIACWIGGTVAFILLRNRTTFRTAHAAAFSAGKSLERVRSGRENDRVVAWIIRGGFFGRRVALRLVERMRY